MAETIGYLQKWFWSKVMRGTGAILGNVIFKALLMIKQNQYIVALGIIGVVNNANINSNNNK